MHSCFQVVRFEVTGQYIFRVRKKDPISFTKIFNRFESQMRRSMTYDQGPERRYHKLSVFSQKQLNESNGLLNMRPRKTLSWKAPAEVFLR